MPITKKQPGEAAGVAAAGNIVGQAQRAEEERAKAERQRARQIAMDWEMQKMMLNSQQDFAHEMRMKQAELDKEGRAKEWEVEKAEIASKMDFEQQERERNKQHANMLNAFAYTKDKADLTPAQKENIDFATALKYSEFGFPEALEILGSSPEYMERQKYGKVLSPVEREMMQAQKEKEAGAATGITAPPTPVTNAMRETEKAVVTEIATGGQYAVRDKATGTIGPVPPEDLADTLATGKYELVKAPYTPTQRAPAMSAPWPTALPKRRPGYTGSWNESPANFDWARRNPSQLMQQPWYSNGQQVTR